MSAQNHITRGVFAICMGLLLILMLGQKIAQMANSAQAPEPYAHVYPDEALPEAPPGP
jgi:hypothetical protein